MLIYDIGPQPPIAPTKPQVLLDEKPLPPGAEGDPRIEPELRRHREREAGHARALANFKAERAAWERDRGGGAIEMACGAVPGAEMNERDPARYVKTLPAGVKLGPLSGANRVNHSTS